MLTPTESSGEYRAEGKSNNGLYSSQEAAREVSRSEGQELARKHGCLFVETSAKANVAVQQAFEELVLKILETPDLLSSSNAPGMKLGKEAQASSSSCC